VPEFNSEAIRWRRILYLPVWLWWQTFAIDFRENHEIETGERDHASGA
jgi:hypothetical protein